MWLRDAELHLIRRTKPILKILDLRRVTGLLKPTSTSWNRIIFADTEEEPSNPKLNLANIMLRKLQEGLMQV